MYFSRKSFFQVEQQSQFYYFDKIYLISPDVQE